MDVFPLRDSIITEYERFATSFTAIRAEDLRAKLKAFYDAGACPTVKKNDEKKFGEYRTKRLILERYDALAAASRTGNYETPLDPPPAHPSMRHPPRK